MKLKKAILFLLMTVVPVAAEASYHLMRNIPLTGDGGWDYLTFDTAARRLYVTHDTTIQVLDGDTLTLIGQVKGTQGAHGVALAPDLGRGFATSGRNGMVVMFDSKTFKTLKKLKAGKNPDAIVYEPVTQRVFAFNGGSKNATVFAATTGETVGTIALVGKPEFPVADGKGAIFVNIEDKHEIAKINGQSLIVEGRWPVAPCQEPSALTMDKTTSRLFAGCGNKKLVVVDAVSGKVITILPIGDHVDAAVFDSERKLIFSSNGEGTITEIQEDSANQYHVVDTIQTQKGARTVAFDPKSHTLYLSDAQFGPTPAPTTHNPHPRPAIRPGTFTILVVSEEEKSAAK